MKWVVMSLFIIHAFKGVSQTGSVNEPVRYIGGQTIDPTVHDGRLRYAIGTENIQVIRANSTHPEMSDGFGWTYNHAPNLAYWNGQFSLQYLSNPKDEHVAPGHTMLVTSIDGRKWSMPQEVFPPYKAPDGVEIPAGYNGYMMHQRMGFYVSDNDRLLVLGFYGHTDHPFGDGGIGRVIREVYKDGSFGPIYFLRYSSFTQFDASNTYYPFYQNAEDAGFVSACDELLRDRLKTLQWLDEDYGEDDFYGSGRVADSLEAFSYYHRPDGKVVGLWKWSVSALSENEGESFSSPVKASTLIMAGGKQWGQRTDDGRYAIVYNPIAMQEYRFPLVAITGDDGSVFDQMTLIHAEVPPRRFFGRWKDFGPCYVRGIVEGNGNPPGNDMWLSYSVNKEDVWISRVPTSVQYTVNGKVKDDFENMLVGGPIEGWNIYSPVWAPSQIVDLKGNQVLRMSDKDPYDYARGIRVFKKGSHKKISFRVWPEQKVDGELEIELNDEFGNRPVRICFRKNGQLVAYNGSEEVVLERYTAHKWYQFELIIQATPHGSYSLKVNGEEKIEDVALFEAVNSVERISFRTGPYRNTPTRKTPNQKKSDPLIGADEPIIETIFYIDDLMVNK